MIDEKHNTEYICVAAANSLTRNGHVPEAVSGRASKPFRPVYTHEESQWRPVKGSSISSGIGYSQIPEKRQLRLSTEYHFSIGRARPASPKGSGSCPALLTVLRPCNPVHECK